MTVDVKVPVLAESVPDATLLEWRKQPGDAVDKDEILIELETDKVVLEVPAPEAGVLAEIVKHTGDTVLSQEVLARIDPGAAASDVAGSPAAAAPARLAAVPEAAAPAPADPPPAPESGGAPARRRARPRRVGDLRHRQGRPDHQGRRARACLRRPRNRRKPVPAPDGRSRRTRPRVPARPRHGPRRRHRRPAPAPAASAPASEPSPVAPAPAPAAPAPAPARAEPVSEAPVPGSRGERREPMSRLRRRIAERLVEAQHTAAILTTFNEIDMQAVIALRARHKERFERRHGVRLGFMSFFARAAVQALQRFPAVNARIDGGDIVYHDYCDIGVAVGSPRGLVVPILRNVEAMSFAEIESSIAEFGARRRATAPCPSTT